MRAIALAATYSIITGAIAQDCNDNGVPDNQDLQATPALNAAPNAFSEILPLAHAIGDLDGDDLPDAIGVSSNGRFSTIENLGDGVFSFPTKQDLEGRLGAVAFGDFDGDQDLDAVVAAIDIDRIYILRNTNGTLAHFGTLSFLIGVHVEDVIVGHFNDDDDPDLAILFEDRVSIELGDTGLTFDGGNADILLALGAQHVETAQLNADTDADLVVMNSTNETLDVLLGNGDGTFQGATTYTVADNPSDIAAFDIEPDGDMDLAVAHASPDDQLRILINDGTGTFSPGETLDTLGSRPRAVTVIDIDDDTDDDLAVVVRNDEVVRILLNDPGTTLTPSDSFLIPRFSAEIVADDADDDGDDDLFVAGLNGTLTLLENVDGTFPSGPTTLASPGTGLWAILAAQLDDDASTDVALLNSSGNLEVYVDLEGVLTLADTELIGGTPIGLVAANLNDDSDLDLGCVASDDGTVAVLINQGLGDFDLTTFNVGALAGGIAFADVNNDMHTDMLASFPGTRNPDFTFGPGTVSVYFNDGSGLFTFDAAYPAGNGPGTLVCVPLDADVFPDIAVVNTNADTVSILINNGDGTFGAPTPLTFAGRTQGIESADLDNDGDNDLVASRLDINDFLNDGVGVFLNNGDATFQPVATYPGGQGLRPITADIDGDGDTDIITGSVFTEDVTILANNGDGAFANARHFIVGDGAIAVAVDPADAAPPTLYVAGFTDGDILAFDNVSPPPFSTDDNGNGIPDECECSCDLTTPTGAVNVADLLAYLDLWFDVDAGAERTGDGIVNVADLLDYLACWFPAFLSGEC